MDNAFATAANHAFRAWMTLAEAYPDTDDQQLRVMMGQLKRIHKDLKARAIENSGDAWVKFD